MEDAKRRMSLALSLTAATLSVVLLTASLAACGQPGADEQTVSPDIAESSSLTSDFSEMSWSDAFDALHSRLSAEYAFTDWKGVDWDALYIRYEHQISAAESADDFTAYYVALHSYLNEIPDGHVSATHISDIDDRYTEGGFGFTLMRTTDHGVVASWVDPKSPAFAAGVREGMELVRWNGLALEDALAATSTVFTKNSATSEDLDWAQLAYLARDMVGTSATAVFKADDGSLENIRLVAYDDAGASLKHAYPAAVLSDKVRSMYLGVEDPSPTPSAMVESRTVDNGVVYIKVWGELDADLGDTGQAPSTLDQFRAAVQVAIDSNAPGVIVDLRNNMGGSDLMAAAMLGSFYKEKTFYEYANVYDASTGTRQIEPVDGSSSDPAAYIDPAEHVYTGPVVALVNMKCVSSGEGIAMGIEKLSNGTVMGFSGTNGSFGLCGPEAVMPGGLTVEWPSGQSLDADKTIQVDSRNGIGGIAPTKTIPMTLENALAIARGEDVELESAIAAIMESKHS